MVTGVLPGLSIFTRCNCFNASNGNDRSERKVYRMVGKQWTNRKDYVRAWFHHISTWCVCVWLACVHHFDEILLYKSVFIISLSMLTFCRSIHSVCSWLVCFQDVIPSFSLFALHLRSRHSFHLIRNFALKDPFCSCSVFSFLLDMLFVLFNLHRSHSCPRQYQNEVDCCVRVYFLSMAVFSKCWSFSIYFQ